MKRTWSWKANKDLQNTQSQDTSNGDLCSPVKLHLPHQSDGQQTQCPIGKGVDRRGSIGRPRCELLGDASTLGVEVGYAVPKVVNGLTLGNSDEHVDNVEYENDGQHAPNHRALPLTGADA